MKLLAFDTSTELLHLGACHGERVLTHVQPGAAQASAQLIPLALSTLTQLDLTLSALDAIVMGRGPGSFTGLRTACAVAQGLAAGVERPVLPIDTLQALAEDARCDLDQARILTILDARMNQCYVAAWQYRHGDWHPELAPQLLDPDQIRLPDSWQTADTPILVAGTGIDTALDALRRITNPAWQHIPAQPSAAALLRLAPWAWSQGHAVAAELAMPLYIRDKVAQTTAERNALRPA